jgi:acyl-CoA reductase-like NAD-dependent aldehyde dehydrogenase
VPIAVTSPATLERLGTLEATGAAGVAAAAEAACDPQRPWALVPPEARARYLRRMAMAILDEVEPLADLLALETGQPRTEALLAELLPSVSGLHGLADDGPAVLSPQRLGRIPALRAGRRNVLLPAPAGVVGIRATDASPWAEPLLEVAAALLAGNAVLLAPAAPLATRRMIAALERAGIPEGLVQAVHGKEAARALKAHCARVSGGVAETEPKGTMLVLEGAPLERTVSGALWAAFATAGRGAFAIGRAIVVPEEAESFLGRMTAAARELRVGDPRDPETEVGPLRNQEDLRAVDTLVTASGGELLCGGPVEVEGLRGAFYAPGVLRGVPAEAEVLTERVPGPVLAVVEAGSEAHALELVAGHVDPEGPVRSQGTVSVWAGDRAHGERVARALGAQVSWVNDHGFTAPAAPVRLARHVDHRQLASQPTRLRSARWLPYDPALVRASAATARLLHGRESERLEVLRAGALPLARTGLRLLREAVGR